MDFILLLNLPLDFYSVRWCGVRRSDTTQIYFAFSATGMSPPAFECVKQLSRPSIPGHIPWHAFPVSASAHRVASLFYDSILSVFFDDINTFSNLLHNCNNTPNVTKLGNIRPPPLLKISYFNIRIGRNSKSPATMKLQGIITGIGMRISIGIPMRIRIGMSMSMGIRMLISPSLGQIQLTDRTRWHCTMFCWL